MEPRVVFQTLYRPAILRGLRICPAQMHSSAPEALATLVEEQVCDQFAHIQAAGKTSVEHRRELLMSRSGHFCVLKSNRTCLYCLVRAAQHPTVCGHPPCDICAQRFGAPAVDVEYRFTISQCCHCLSRVPCAIDILPPTMNPTALAIDGGGVRGVIPLEFLGLLQEQLGPKCRLQDLVDLAIGTSSGRYISSAAKEKANNGCKGGLIVLGLFVLQWDVLTCSRVFERLARRIFQERLKSAFSWLPGLMLGRIRKWLTWWLHDGCYDGTIFDTTLKEIFGEHRRMFGALELGPFKPTISRTKVGVVATNIARDTKSFIFGNFNAARVNSEDCGKMIAGLGDVQQG